MSNSNLNFGNLECRVSSFLGWNLLWFAASPWHAALSSPSRSFPATISISSFSLQEKDFPSSLLLMYSSMMIQGFGYKQWPSGGWTKVGIKVLSWADWKLDVLRCNLLYNSYSVFLKLSPFCSLLLLVLGQVKVQFVFFNLKALLYWSMFINMHDYLWTCLLFGTLVSCLSTIQIICLYLSSCSNLVGTLESWRKSLVSISSTELLYA